MKSVLQEDELLEFIKNNKKIVFNNLSEEKDMKKLLISYNYLNIFSLKYFFADGKKKYLELLKFENKIRDGVLKYEIELKSHFIFFLEDFFRKNDLNFKKFLYSLEDYDYNIKSIKSISEKTLNKIESEWKNKQIYFL